MKKIFCILLSMLMIISVVGCSASEEPEIIENEAVLGNLSSESSSETIEITPSSSESSSVTEFSESESSSESSSESKAESSSSSSSSKTETSSSSESSVSSESSSLSSSESSSVSESSSESSSSEEEKPVQNTYAPSGETKAVWISYLEYQSIMQGKSKSQFTSNIKTMFGNLANDGFNTVSFMFVHTAMQCMIRIFFHGRFIAPERKEKTRDMTLLK